ncbi:N-acetylmuramoyl-L-alanine amidase (plasmid) [Serratia marcescens]|nr:N-acetylmuramoyl-L-alanine amidase [Serratia marcescens]
MLKVLLPIAILLVSGCSTRTKSSEGEQEYHVDRRNISQSQDGRIRHLVFHYTAVEDAKSLELLTKGQVSAHYLIPAEPEFINGKPIVLQLVPEEMRAWHAGVSDWGSRNSINDTSIGIEIVNSGFTEDVFGDKTWYPFSEKQIYSLSLLAKDIVERNNISPENIIGHSDISPTRKSDPGPLFPWARLAGFGIGAWPDAHTVTKYLAGRSPDTPGDVARIQRVLKQYGYSQIPQSGVLDEETRKNIVAFQMHFRAGNISGAPDVETESIAKALLEKYKGIESTAL